MFKAKLLLVTLPTIVACAASQPEIVTVQQPGGDGYRHEVATQDGHPHGEATGWYRSGELAYHGAFLHGQRHGTFNFFHENGNWLRVEEYDRGRLLWSTTVRAEAESVGASTAAALSTTAASSESEKLSREELEDDLDAWWKSTGQLWLGGFPQMAILSNRSGVEFRMSTQEVKQAGVTAVSTRYQLALAQQLSRIGLPEWGFYGTMTIPKIAGTSFELPSSGRSTVETGARWLAPDQRIAFRAGVMKAFAHDDLDGHLAARDTLQQGISDAVGSYPRSTALRTHATYVGEYELLNYRVDSGLDVAWGTDDGDDVRLSRSAVALARLDFGVAFATRLFGLAAEVHSALPLAGEELDGLLLNTTLSGQFRGSWAWTSISAIFPISGPDASVGLAVSLSRHMNLL